MAQSMASDDRTLLRPAEAAQRLGIPASTLRRWSRRFAPFLSPYANGQRDAGGTRGHRRYTPQDVAVLAQCKALLSQGLTLEQVAEKLATDFEPEVMVVEGEVTEGGNMDGGQEGLQAPETGEMVSEPGAVELGRMLVQMLSTLSGSQQMLLTGQQTERELLGIVVQDNLNLKEENRRLRERIVETERRIFEMKREMERYRDEERERMRQMEAYMFQLQRQLDDLVRNQRTSVSPVAASYHQSAFTPQPGPMHTAAPGQPASHPSSDALHSTGTASSIPSPSTTPEAASSTDEQHDMRSEKIIRKKRSFWDWLFGRGG